MLLSKRCPRRRLAVLRNDLGFPSSMSPTITMRRCLYSANLALPAILLSCCAIFVTTECHAQDLADAAKQERARKDSKKKKSKNVYTDENLKRAQTLTTEYRAQ